MQRWYGACMYVLEQTVEETDVLGGTVEFRRPTLYCGEEASHEQLRSR